MLETAFCCKSAVPMNAAVASNNIREVKYTEEERKERRIQQLCHGVVSDEEFGCEKLTRNRRAKEANKPPRSHQKTESCRHHSVSPVVVPKPAARQRKLTAEAAENASPEMVSLSIAERKRLLVANMSDLPSGANWVKPDMAPVVAANASSPPTLQ